ncbi:solute carrier family 22 member 18-like [Mytilus galloprovincialis]|uniref:solute carrier family 22 member 18-like n=1 Tax=Mytilus galloprovincialis TaxID=29158 RepID=UPI003F7C0D48
MKNRMTEKPKASDDDKSPEMKQEMPPEKTDEVKVFGWRFNKAVFVTHINIFLYSTCFWIQTGTLPYLTKKLGVDPVMFGYLQTTFAVVQLAGGPLFGQFGDKMGGQAAMMLAFFSASLSYLLLGMSGTFLMLFISRLPSVFMHAMQAGQMIVTDTSSEKERAGALGMLGLSYGVGMVLGPFIGGLVIKFFSEQSAAYTSFLGSLLSVYLTWQFIPQKTKRIVVTSEVKEQSLLSIKKILQLATAPGALFLLTVRALAGIPIGVFQSMFSVVAMETFKLLPEQNGYMMSYVGILTMIVQGLGVKVLTKKFSENDILKWSSFLLVWSYLALAFVKDIFQMCLVMTPLVVGLASSNIVISSALTRTVSALDTGVMLGLNMAVNSFIRSLSPTVGGYLLQYFGFPVFGYLGFTMLSFVTILLFIKFRE